MCILSLIGTHDPYALQTVLATDFNNFVKGENFNAFMNSVLGSGVFNADGSWTLCRCALYALTLTRLGEMWKFHRSMTRPFFSRDRISHFDIFEKHAGASHVKSDSFCEL